MVDASKRFTKEKPCPICGGYQNRERGTDARCHGYLTPKGANCSNVESDRPNKAGDLFWHSQGRATSGGTRGRITHQYLYENEHGVEQYQVVRLHPKDFRVRRRDSTKNSGWDWSLGDTERVLYRKPNVIRARDAGEEVYCAEGEKDVDTLEQAGVTATCNSGGALKWRDAYTQDLVGCSRVTIVADWDKGDGKSPFKGQRHALEVYESLARGGVRARIVRAQSGKDASDHLEAGHGVDDFVAVDVAELRKLVARPPDALEVPDLSWKPFPMDALPSGVRRVVEEGTAAIGCDSAMLAAPMLVALTACIGNSRVLQIKTTWFARMILWLGVVADSGAMKSPCIGFVMTPLRRIEQQLLEPYARELEAYQEATIAAAKSKSGAAPVIPPKPENPRVVLSDTTPEAAAALLSECWRGLLVHRDELAGWLSFDSYKAKRGGEESFWLECHDGGTINVDRRTSPPLVIPRAAISILGSIQPRVLAKSVTSAQRASGLIARFLTMMPPRVKKRWREAEVAESTLRQLEGLYRQLLGLKPHADGNPVRLTFSPEAKKVWVKFYNIHGEKQDTAEGDEASFLSKLEEKCARFALLLEILDAADTGQAHQVTEVTAESVRRAIMLVEWFQHECYRLYDFLDSSEDDRQLGRLLDWLQRAERTRGKGVTVSEVRKGIRFYKRDGELIRADLQNLIDRGLVRKVDQPAGQTGGRPTERFQVVQVSEAEEVSGTESAATESADEPDAEVSEVLVTGTTGTSADAGCCPMKAAAGDDEDEEGGFGDSCQSEPGAGEVRPIAEEGVVREQPVDGCGVSGVDLAAIYREVYGSEVDRVPETPEPPSPTPPAVENRSSSGPRVPETRGCAETPPGRHADDQRGSETAVPVTETSTTPGPALADDSSRDPSTDSRRADPTSSVDASAPLGDSADEVLVAWAEGVGPSAVPSQPTRVRNRSVSDPRRLLAGIVGRFHSSETLSPLDRADLVALWNEYEQGTDASVERSAPDDLSEGTA